MASFLELLASYQGNRSLYLKDKRESQVVELEEFFSDGELDELLHQRNVSRFVSHCNFAIDSISLRGESIKPELLEVLNEQEQRIVRMRIENRLGFSEIANELAISVGQAKVTFEKSMRKVTKHIRSKQDLSAAEA